MEEGAEVLESACSGRKRKWNESEQQGASEKKIKMKGDNGNLLLASYLAHEYLTHGTLFGRKWAPGADGDSQQQQQVSRRMQEIYNEVAIILKTDDVHIPQIVNPSQLASWLHLCQ